jgi:hypothetical protein
MKDARGQWKLRGMFRHGEEQIAFEAVRTGDLKPIQTKGLLPQ